MEIAAYGDGPDVLNSALEQLSWELCYICCHLCQTERARDVSATQTCAWIHSVHKLGLFLYTEQWAEG